MRELQNRKRYQEIYIRLIDYNNNKGKRSAKAI